MTRIFTTLAAVNALALAVALATGVVAKLGDGLHDPQTFLAHFTTGLFTAIGTLFVHCLIFTYFLGTGRWVKEVGLAYGLPDAPLPRQTRELKRTTFPVALAAMLVTIATAAAGMGTQRQEWPWQIHGTLALATVLVNAWAFFIEYRNVRANGLIIEEVMAEVERIRRERGLTSNLEELQKDGWPTDSGPDGSAQKTLGR